MEEMEELELGSRAPSSVEMTLEAIQTAHSAGRRQYQPGNVNSSPAREETIEQDSWGHRLKSSKVSITHITRTPAYAGLTLPLTLFLIALLFGMALELSLGRIPQTQVGLSSSSAFSPSDLWPPYASPG